MPRHQRSVGGHSSLGTLRDNLVHDNSYVAIYVVVADFTLPFGRS